MLFVADAYTTDFIRLNWSKVNPVLVSSADSKLYMREFDKIKYTVGQSVSGYKGVGKTQGKKLYILLRDFQLIA